MTKLKKIEKETIILFNEAEDMANIYTYNASLKKSLEAFSRKYPDLCRLEKPECQGGVSYLLHKPRLSIRLQPHTVRNADKKPASMPSKMVSTVRQSNASIRGVLRSEYRVCT